MIETIQRNPRLSERDRSAVRSSLLDRRRRLQASRVAGATAVASLLVAVDAALDRLETGGFGQCTRCDGLVEPDRLVADPLATVCLDCLSESERHALQRDLELASRVQATLLPPRDFESAGWRGHYSYRPHGTVGGDYVDLLPPDGPDDGLIMMLGDVSGKGIAAAMLMSHLHAGMRAIAGAGCPLGELLARANRLLHGASAANLYATLAAVRLMANGDAEIATAGHPPILVVGRRGVTPVATQGLPVGLFGGSAYRTTRVRLAPGEAMVLYTDGVTESLDSSGQELGVEALSRALETIRRGSAREIVDDILAMVDARRGGGSAHDDLTVAAISR